MILFRKRLLNDNLQAIIYRDSSDVDCIDIEWTIMTCDYILCHKINAFIFSFSGEF